MRDGTNHGPGRDAADEARLLAALDAALERERVGRGPDSVAGASGDAGLSALRDRCAAALDPDHVGGPAADARVRRVERAVLARTTREDLGRGRDLGLVLDFFADRLRESALLRVAAAAVLVHLTLVPLVAYHLVGESERPQLTIRLSDDALEQLEEELPRRDPDVRLVDEDTGPEVDLSPLPTGSLEVADRLSDRARAWLADLELPPATTELGHVLEAATADVAEGRGASSVALAQLVERLELTAPPARAGAAQGDLWIQWIAGGLAAEASDDPLVSAWLAAARGR